MTGHSIGDDIPALGMVLLAEASGVRFLGNDRVLPATTALMSGDLVRALLKLSSWTLGLEQTRAILALGSESRTGNRKRLRVGEHVLLAAAFDHALEISPKASDCVDDASRAAGTDESGDGSGDPVPAGLGVDDLVIQAIAGGRIAGARVIDIEALKVLVRRIESVFGPIRIDNALADQIVMAAWDRLFPEGPDTPLQLEG